MAASLKNYQNKHAAVDVLVKNTFPNKSLSDEPPITDHNELKKKFKGHKKTSQAQVFTVAEDQTGDSFAQKSKKDSKKESKESKKEKAKKAKAKKEKEEKEAKAADDAKAKKAEAFAEAMAKHRAVKEDKKEDSKDKKGADDKAALEKDAIDKFAKALANARVKGDDGEKKCAKKPTPEEYDE